MSGSVAEPGRLCIRRLSLRVVRRGGWSWGRAPEALAAGATRALPALLAQELAGLLGEQPAATQAARVKVKVRLGAAELAALGARVAPGASRPPRHASTGPVHIGAEAAACPPELRAKVRAALVTALAEPAVRAGWVAEAASAVGGTARAQAPEAGGSPGAAGPEPGTGLVGTLLGWLADGTLAARLAALPDDLLHGWERELLAPAGAVPPAPPPVSAADVARVVGAAAAALVHAPPRRGAEARIIVALAAQRALGLGACDPALRSALDRALGRPAAVSAGDAGAKASPAPGVAVGSRQAARALDAGDERHVASALPFVVLAALARLGWLDAASAFLLADGAGAASGSSAAFATALAHKLLAAPERGWRRSSDATAAAACFAGRAAPVDDAELSALAERLEGRTAALDELARQPFLDGHVAGDPLLLVRAGHAGRDGWLLAEARGSFALAWSAEAAGLAPALAGPCARSLVLVPAAAASPPVLAWLTGRGQRFVTDAPPARGERHVAIPGIADPRLYASAPGLVAGAVPAEARQLAALAGRTVAAWHAVAIDRPAVARTRHLDLDASLSLAASLALADLAWRLFRAREPTSAQLVLDRFADLDAHVRVDPAVVRVRLPLGRRFQDLGAHGLLADVPRVPWWDGRTLVFSGG